MNFQIGDSFAGTAGDPDRNRRAYDDSAAYLSSTYRTIFRELSSSFDYVITLADHGELLGEHDLWNHGYGLYPELTHVPLVISGDVDSDDREGSVSLLDVPQTVADLAGIEFDSRGRSLIGDTEPRDRLVEYHGFLPWHRGQFERKGVGEVYDRLDSPLTGLVTASGRYFYQTHDEGIRSPMGRLRADDRSRLDSLTESVPERATQEDHEEVSDDIKDRLRELGYA